MGDIALCSRGRNSMKSATLKVPGFVIPIGALLMLGIGMLLGRATVGGQAVTTPKPTSPRASTSPSRLLSSLPVPAQGKVGMGNEVTRRGRTGGDVTVASAPLRLRGGDKGGGVPAPRGGRAMTPPVSTRAEVGTGGEVMRKGGKGGDVLPLPPLSPPNFGAQPTALDPPPNVLWLSGVIQGNPKVALFRRGDNRYLVKEGGVVEGYQVANITSNSVTIQRGSRKRTLRIGQR